MPKNYIGFRNNIKVKQVAFYYSFQYIGQSKNISKIFRLSNHNKYSYQLLQTDNKSTESLSVRNGKTKYIYKYIIEEAYISLLVYIVCPNLTYPCHLINTKTT